MKERKERGLCYNYDEKWGPSRKCKVAPLFILECTYSSEEEKPQTIFNSSLVEEEGSQPNEENVNLDPTLEISINALWGSPTSRMIQIMGYINGYDVVILIDTRSMHNFMDPLIQQRVLL